MEAMFFGLERELGFFGGLRLSYLISIIKKY
jgi:hypothetical protein